LFLYGMKAPMTREKYRGRLAKFFDFIGLTEGTMEERAKTFTERCKKQPEWVFVSILRFAQTQKERVSNGEISPGTLRNYIKAIKLFCEMNDIIIVWKKITRGLPRTRRFADDRAPTLDEIRRIIEYPDRRIKPVVYTMTSSGIRLEAWNYLRWSHVKPIERDGKVIAAKMTVYAGDPEEYFTFISSEAYHAISRWMKFRRDSGEDISPKSWVMRDLWDTKKGCIQHFVTIPKKLKATGVKRLVEDALWTQRLRTKLPDGKRRHEFQANHGFRKFFKTMCETAGVKSIVTETLMGHSTGISDSYYRPTEKELLEEYLKATDLLTISEEKYLHHQVEKLKTEILDIDTLKKMHIDTKMELEKERQERIKLYELLYQQGIIKQEKI
jgi:integrase